MNIDEIEEVINELDVNKSLQIRTLANAILIELRKDNDAGKLALSLVIATLQTQQIEKNTPSVTYLH